MAGVVCLCDASRASEFLRDYDGSVIQMRVAYSAVAHFLLQWTDCKLAGALGLLKVMLYKVSPPCTLLARARARLGFSLPELAC